MKSLLERLGHDLEDVLVEALQGGDALQLRAHERLALCVVLAVCRERRGDARRDDRVDLVELFV